MNAHRTDARASVLNGEASASAFESFGNEFSDAKLKLYFSLPPSLRKRLSMVNLFSFRLRRDGIGVGDFQKGTCKEFYYRTYGAP